MSKFRAYRAEDFQTPALGISLRWTLIGVQIGRRNYIARWGK
jgi:hypothetical protein